MCLDPRPDRLVRTSVAKRRLPVRPPAFVPALAPGLPASIAAPVIKAPAFWALEALAADDELVARGWVVLSRDH